jgi:hypothetical protein
MTPLPPTGIAPGRGLVLAAEKFWSLVNNLNKLFHLRGLADHGLEACNGAKSLFAIRAVPFMVQNGTV